MTGQVKQKPSNKTLKKGTTKKALPLETKNSSVNLAVENLPVEADRQKMIAVRAYQLWLRDGKCHGLDRVHWLQAEKEIGL